MRFFKLLPICLVAIAGVAHADGIPFVSNGRTFEVGYGDLDLSKADGQKQLKARLRRAAVKVCPGRTLQETRPCQIAAFEQVRAPVAAAIARAQGGERYAAASAQAAPLPGQ